MNILEKNISDFTLDEFFTFLNLKKEDIIRIRKRFSNGLALYENCCVKEEYFDQYRKQTKVRFMCFQNKIEKMLETKKGTDTLKLILMHVLGEKFFELSEEENLESEKNGYFSKLSIDRLFENCIANYYGRPIVSPNSFDDIINNIINLIAIIKDNNILPANKEKYLMSLRMVETLIANKYGQMIARYDEQSYAIEIIEKIMKAKKANKRIELTDQERNIFSELLNKNILIETTNDNGEVTYETTEYGNVTTDCIDRYNNEVEKQSANKQLNKKATKYYKIIKKTPLERLKNEMLPEYSDDDVVEIYRILFNKFDDDVNKTKDDKVLDDLVTKYAVTQMRYAGYFTSEYYDEEKVFGNSK